MSLLCLASIPPAGIGSYLPPLLVMFVATGYLTAQAWGWGMCALPLPFALVSGIQARHPGPGQYASADFLTFFVYAFIATLLGVVVGIGARRNSPQDPTDDNHSPRK